MPNAGQEIYSTTEYQQFIAIISSGFAEQQLERITLAKNTNKNNQLEKILIRPVAIKQQPMLSWIYRYKTQDITKNYTLDEAVIELAQQIEQGFKHIHIKTHSHDYQLMISKKNKVVLHQKNQLTQTQSASQHLELPKASTIATVHNRQKQRYIAQDRPFLQQLGITDQQHQIIPAMARKWKQINKFVEIFSGAIHQAGLEQQTISVVDFGSGKGYLTFAIYDYIQQQLQRQVKVTGVELRDELVQFCNGVATRIAANGIEFYQGDVRSFTPDHIDVMIALHACDTATDFALHTGIRLNASIIMCAPCCHKEIRPQLKMPSLLQPMLQYGVHLGQQAEMLTDSLRALLLEAHGYETKVFEFVALEHTSKNKMILAVKKSKTAEQQAQILQKIEALKQFYGIEQHTLETLLQQ